MMCIQVGPIREGIITHECILCLYLVACKGLCGKEALLGPPCLAQWQVYRPCVGPGTSLVGPVCS